MMNQTRYQVAKAPSEVRAIISTESPWTTVVWGLVWLLTIGSIAAALADLASSLP